MIKNTKVVNCKVKYIKPLGYNNLQNWINDNNDNIYIARAGIVFINKERYPKQSSIWANPFKITKDLSREEVINQYKNYILQKLENDINLQYKLFELKGKNLGCWCHPDQCHGDILLEMIKLFTICHYCNKEIIDKKNITYCKIYQTSKCIDCEHNTISSSEKTITFECKYCPD